jgi:hypothetical protein
MENKQTTVEWQFEQLFNSFEKFNNGECTFNDFLKRNLEIRKQAKAMEKEQIMKTFLFQSPIGDGVITAVQKAEQYYKETYETKK